MRYFISDNGIEAIGLTNQELGKKLSQGRTPNQNVIDYLVAEIEESYIIIKHPNCTMEELCYLCDSTSKGSPNIRMLQASSKDLYENYGMMTVVTSIYGYGNNFYAQTLNVRRDMLEPMIRKGLIDEFLIDNA